MLTCSRNEVSIFRLLLAKENSVKLTSRNAPVASLKCCRLSLQMNLFRLSFSGTNAFSWGFSIAFADIFKLTTLLPSKVSLPILFSRLLVNQRDSNLRPLNTPSGRSLIIFRSRSKCLKAGIPRKASGSKDAILLSLSISVSSAGRWWNESAMIVRSWFA